MNSKYKAKATDSFKTKLALYLFDRISNCKIQMINLADFTSFEINNNLVNFYTTVYWQELPNFFIGNKTIADIEKEIGAWTNNNWEMIASFHKQYIEVRFPEIYPPEKFDALLKHEECAYCGITIKEIIELGDRHKLRKKNYRGWVLEIDRLDSNIEYTPQNTVMACYWCNNAKTDEFTFEEFRKVGKAIHQIWQERLNDNK